MAELDKILRPARLQALDAAAARIGRFGASLEALDDQGRLGIQLGVFLDQAWRTPFAWGRFDCILWLADWSAAVGAGDPGHPWRGRYQTRLGAARIIRQAGGIAALVDREFTGWRRTETPAAGDIGLIQAMTPQGPGLSGGVCLGDRWAVLSSSGLIVGQFRPVAAWSHSCPR